jgi:predicted ATPase/class 3 adenylate cyclase
MGEGSRLPSGTVTFVFTDIEGSTKLLNELGTDRFHEVLAVHTRLLRDAFRDVGHEVRIEGDALFVVFPVAASAVRAAAAAQRALAQTSFPHGATVRVRMGMHTGEATPASAEAGADYVGIDVHRAARIAAAAHGGQVLLSEATATLARSDLGADISLRDLGDFHLKDLARPERIYQLVIAGCPADFPPIRSLDRTPTRLPPQPTTFVGRDREIAEGQRLLERARLVTLTGPGGTGKTRLSIRIAEESAHAFDDGTFFVPLAPISDPGLVPSTIAHTLGVQVGGTEMPLPRVIEHVRDKRMLLVLDNFEQILPAAIVVRDILGASPYLKVIASSRAPLRVAGEQEFPVPPLELPDPERLPALEVLAQSDAVRLFVERAMAVRPDFRVTPENAAAIAEIVYRLDGLPLAIELAAARVKVLTPQAILPKLRQGLDVLASSARDLPERQRTLRGAIEWSWNLLEPPEQRLFARFAIFVAGAMLPQIESVCCRGAELGRDVLDVLTALVEHSLIRQSEIDGEPRFRMLVTIRDFALEKLAASGEHEDIATRHADAFVVLAEEAAPDLLGPEQTRWLDLLELEHDNLRAALDSSISRGWAERACRIVFALWRFWQKRGHLAEAAEWCVRVRTLLLDGVPPVTQMRFYEAQGGIGYWRGVSDVSEDAYQRALALAEQYGTDADRANAAYNLSFAYGIAKVDERALELLRVAKERWLKAGDRAGVGRASWALATYLHFGVRGTIPRAQLGEALAAVEDALAIHRATTNRFDVAWDLHLRGMIHLKLDNLEAALHDFREAATIFTEDRDVSGLAMIASNASELAAARGDRERQAVLVGLASALEKRAGTGLFSRLRVQDGRWMEPDVPAELRPAFERGQAMPLEEGIAYAVEREQART